MTGPVGTTGNASPSGACPCMSRPCCSSLGSKTVSFMPSGAVTVLEELGIGLLGGVRQRNSEKIETEIRIHHRRSGLEQERGVLDPGGEGARRDRREGIAAGAGLTRHLARETAGMSDEVEQANVGDVRVLGVGELRRERDQRRRELDFAFGGKMRKHQAR